MAQWVNRLRNNIFVNPPPLPLLYKIQSGALHLAQPGITIDTTLTGIGNADVTGIACSTLSADCPC